MRARFVVTLLTVSVWAGCLGGPAAVLPSPATGPMSVDDVLSRLSAPLGDVVVKHEALDLPTSLGSLRVDVYRPDPTTVPADWRAPIVLTASPYNGPAKDSGDDNRMALGLYEWLEAHLVPRGYAVAHLDLLGTGSSDGCTAVMDANERKATAEVIDLLGEMEWSNGRIGMIGKSYVGASQVYAALEDPEHLATIVPISPVTNAYAYHYRNGVPYLGNQATNALYLTYGNAAHATGLDGLGAGKLPQAGDPSGVDPTCAPESIAQGANPLGDYTDRWAERDARPLIPDMRRDIGVLFVHGHQDWNVKPDHFSDVWELYPVDTKMAMLGQWHHDYPDTNRWEPDAHGAREDWYWLLHRWFDHFLLGIDTGIADEAKACPVQSQASDASWHCLDNFPAKTTTDLEVTSTLGSVSYHELLQTARWTHTFTNRTHVVGIPNITMPFSTTSPYNAHIVVALQVGGQDIDWAIQSLRHRNGLTGEPVIPGETYELAIDFYMLDHVFEPGDQMGIEIRGLSTVPNLGVTPNPLPGVNTVDLSETVVHLPVLTNEHSFRPLAKDALPAEYNPTP